MKNHPQKSASTAGIDPFLEAFKGSFTSALRWHQLDDLWEQIEANAQGWYIYAVGEQLPEAPASVDELRHFIDQVDQLLRRDHDEDYCGIVYSDNPKQPGMVKIYDPHNLGVTCGFSDNPPLPGWVLTRIPPIDLAAEQHIVAKNRKRWWRRLFG